MILFVQFSIEVLIVAIICLSVLFILSAILYIRVSSIISKERSEISNSQKNQIDLLKQELDRCKKMEQDLISKIKIKKEQNIESMKEIEKKIKILSENYYNDQMQKITPQASNIDAIKLKIKAMAGLSDDVSN